ncbi:MAG: Coenzyme F420 hydrogenase/dehydrogenase, beta subunit C-terminal domain, partial [Candidatus Saccharibacteria bacterium]|nr:Coenzyme F420 hydrogenase/dehydrogenase, beta subunit C-terminal domain [Candidatus Saccharibacteria bacterium]
MSITNSREKLFGIKDVLQQGLCIGCGACTNQSEAVTIQFNRYGELTANISKVSSVEIAAIDKVCPFSDAAPNENILAEAVFKSEPNIGYSEVLGYHNGLFAGFSNAYRSFGSSGGIVSWTLAEVLRTQTVDAVIVVGRTSESDRFFDFKVITDVQELKSAGTSFYYPVSYDNVLKYIQETPGKYAITGVPCFHKALRQLRLVNPIIDQRVVLQIGIVCGQMKSSYYLEYLDRKAVKTTPLVNACFRRKDEDSRADDYLFEGEFINNTGDREKRIVRNRDIGSNWAMGLFKPKACDFCDDVYAETAD